MIHRTSGGGSAAARGLRTSALGVALALWLGVRWTVLPTTVAPDDVEPADAVVVFAGASERLPAALALMAAGKAEVLVIPNGTREGWSDANRLCAGGRIDDHRVPFEVLCPVPDPVTTRGEARAIGEAAAQRRWQSVVAVTSSYHIARAELVLERCFPGRIQAVGVGSDLPGDLWWRLARHEVAGHLAFRLVFRGC